MRCRVHGTHFVLRMLCVLASRCPQRCRVEGCMAGVVYCILLHQGDLSVVGCSDVCSALYIVCSLHQGALSGVGCAERIFCHACCVFLHQGALSGIGWKDTWQVWCIVCSCIKMFVRYGILCVSCIKVSLTVSGALDVCCMYAVCSCTKVPLVVSGVRILGMCGVLYVLASKCL